MNSFRDCLNFLSKSLPPSPRSSNSSPRTRTYTFSPSNIKEPSILSTDTNVKFPIPMTPHKVESNLKQNRNEEFDSLNNAVDCDERFYEITREPHVIENFLNDELSQKGENNISLCDDVDFNHINESSNTQICKKILLSSDISQKNLLSEAMNIPMHPTILYQLPNDIFIEVVSYLSIQENAIVSLVSKKIYKFCNCDYIWKGYYVLLFYPSICLQPPELSEKMLNPLPNSSFKHLCIQKYRNPSIGDRIQIFWIGQFILAQQGPYKGKSWWYGDIIDTRQDPVTGISSYHVRYEGWQNTWDEWVVRGRIRWAKWPDIYQSTHAYYGIKNSSHLGPMISFPMPRNAAYYIPRSLCQHEDFLPAGTRVELQISGRLCQAWLECTIGSVERGEHRTPLYVIRDAAPIMEIVASRDRMRRI